MIFAHILIGVLLGLLYGNYYPFIIGSIIPDLDHLYIIAKNGLWKSGKLIDSIKNETNYGIRYKTKL